MDLHLVDKVALVTGSSRGLGFASAKALVGEGARVCVCARGAEGLAKAVTDLEAGASLPGQVIGVESDLSTVDGVELVINRTVDTYGGLDILVNNVGKAGGSDILETTDPQWQAALEQTLYPAIRASRAAVPHMRRRGGGVIIMITSIWGRESGGRMTYNAVKAAEISLSKSLAQQLANDDIRVNNVAPGSILFAGGSWAKRSAEDPEGMAAFVKRELPFGRFGRAEEVGDVVAFLASSRASWISGASVTVDGCQSRALF